LREKVKNTLNEIAEETGKKTEPFAQRIRKAFEEAREEAKKMAPLAEGDFLTRRVEVPPFDNKEGISSESSDHKFSHTKLFASEEEEENTITASIDVKNDTSPITSPTLRFFYSRSRTEEEEDTEEKKEVDMLEGSVHSYETMQERLRRCHGNNSSTPNTIKGNNRNTRSSSFLELGRGASNSTCAHFNWANNS